MRRLVLLRHAVAEEKGGGRDFERELTAQGRTDAAVMGRWLVRQALQPDRVVSSPAPRALQTAAVACEALGIDVRSIDQDAALYDAGPTTLLHRLGRIPAKAKLVLLVGHNPSLEQLAVHLTGDDDLLRIGLPKAGAIAMDLPNDWVDLGAKTARQWKRADPSSLGG